MQVYLFEFPIYLGYYYNIHPGMNEGIKKYKQEHEGLDLQALINQKVQLNKNMVSQVVREIDNWENTDTFSFGKEYWICFT